MADERFTRRGLVRRGTVATCAAVWKFLTMGLIKQRRASAGHGVVESPPRRLAVTLAPVTNISLSLVFCMAFIGHCHQSSGQEPESKKATDPAVDGAAKEIDEDEQLEIAVDVVDENGQPVADASVFLQAGFKIPDQQQTDPQGRTTIRYAPDLVLRTIGAVKPGVGCDYRAFEKAYLEVDKSHPNKLPQNFQGSVQFVLNGIREVSVKVIGPDGDPLPGIPVKPWLITKPDRGDDWNLPELEIFTATTHNDGIAVLGTIPADQQRGVQCWPRLSRDDWFVIGNHSSMDNGSAYIQWSQGDSATVHIAKKVAVAGRAVDSDAQPVAGIRVVAMGGHLYTGWSNANATTDREGNWQMLVKPDGYYIFAVRDQTYAAPAHAGVVVRREDLDRQLEFVIQPARRVYGKVSGPVGKGTYIMLQQRAKDYRGIPEHEQLPSPDGKSRHVSAFIQETSPSNRMERLNSRSGQVITSSGARMRKRPDSRSPTRKRKYSIFSWRGRCGGR